MNIIEPISQIRLFGLGNYLNELIHLYKKNKLPNKILFSGEKGIGKCTLAYHIVNYILSLSEENPYDTKNLQINSENKSFKLVQNKSNPNFILIDVSADKKNIDIFMNSFLINVQYENKNLHLYMQS